MSAPPVPREFQSEMFLATRKATLMCSATLVQAPTGAGKTFLACMFAKAAFDKGRRVTITVHRDFLITQTADMLAVFGVEFGIIAAGYTANPRAKIQIAAIDTLKNRLERVAVCDLLIIDEAHHSVAAGWAKVIAFYIAAGAKVIGLTATPVRLDGRGLGEFYQEMVRGPSVRWLIDQGFLSDYAAYAPSVPDMSSVHTRMGDFIKSEAEEVVDKPTITGDAIREYQRLAPGKRAVVFCISVVHSQHVCDQFNAAGITAAHIDGNTERGIRKDLLKKFRKGEILVLTSVEIFGEGFDLPAVEVAILLRPTQSLSLHLQQIGRVLRVAEGKDRAIILDHVGNLMRPGLGLPDSDFDWSLEGRVRKKGKKKDEAAIEIQQCEMCFAVYPPALTCPTCGHTRKIAPRKLEEVDGELVAITPEMAAAMKLASKKKLQSAKTLDELKALAAERGYSENWAQHTYDARRTASNRHKEAAGMRRAEAQAAAFLR